MIRDRILTEFAREKLENRKLKAFVEAFRVWNEEACAESDAVVETWEALMDAFEQLEVK